MLCDCGLASLLLLPLGLGGVQKAVGSPVLPDCPVGTGIDLIRISYGCIFVSLRGVVVGGRWSGDAGGLFIVPLAITIASCEHTVVRTDGVQLVVLDEAISQTSYLCPAPSLPLSRGRPPR